MFLRSGTTPSSAGYPGKWVKTAFFITDSSYRVIQREGDGFLKTAGYSANDNQQWHLTALDGNGSSVSEYSMWVRVS